MPIIVQHQPSPASVGLAAYTSGLGQANERKRKEQLSQLQQMYDKRFQYGMNQLRYGQEQQLAQDRFLQQKQWQDARDEREFQQKQQIGNAEARARGEPLPFPGQGQGQQQGDMTGGVLPGGRQQFAGPDTTITGPDSGGGMVAPSDPFASAPSTRPGFDANGGYVGKTPLQQREELARQQRQAAEDQKIRDGIDKGTHKVPQDIETKRDKNASDLVKLELNKEWTGADKDKARATLLAEKKELDGLAVRYATPVPKQTPDEQWEANVRYADPKTGALVPKGTPGAVPVQFNPKQGTYARIDLGEKPDTTTTMTAAQTQRAKQQSDNAAAKYRADREKRLGNLEDNFSKMEGTLRTKIAKEVIKDRTEKKRVLGVPISRAWTEKDAENDPDLKADIDARMEEERKKRVDARLEAAYPTPQAPVQGASQQTPAAPEYDLAPTEQPTQAPVSAKQQAPGRFITPDGGKTWSPVPYAPPVEAWPGSSNFTNKPDPPAAPSQGQVPAQASPQQQLPPGLPPGSQMLPDGRVRLPDGTIIKRKVQ